MTAAFPIFTAIAFGAFLLIVLAHERFRDQFDGEKFVNQCEDQLIRNDQELARRMDQLTPQQRHQFLKQHKEAIDEFERVSNRIEDQMSIILEDTTKK